jgi:hypothetical protein
MNKVLAVVLAGALAMPAYGQAVEATTTTTTTVSTSTAAPALTFPTLRSKPELTTTYDRFTDSTRTVATAVYCLCHGWARGMSPHTTFVAATFYPGQTKTAPANTVVLLVQHLTRPLAVDNRTSVKETINAPITTELQLIYDDNSRQRFDMKLIDRDIQFQRNTTTSTTYAVAMSVADFVKLAGSKNLQGRVNGEEFTLKDRDLAGFTDLAATLNPALVTK